MEHYVYEWWRMDLNLPYYVGKGQQERCRDLKRNRHTDCVTEYLLRNGIARDIRIIARFVSEESAFEYEKERIAFWWHLKEHNILTNQTLGGDGVRGYKWSDDQKASHYMVKIETRNDNVLFGSGSDNPMWGVRAEKHPFYGKTHTKEVRKVLSEKQKGLRPGNAKFSDEKVISILEDTRSTNEIAADNSCCERTIRNIKRGRAYINVYQNWLSEIKKGGH